ncbi:prolipoprotein diacylglyceryl transferase family protein [Chloroflexota bacterium]
MLRFRNKITQNGLLFLSYLTFYSIGRFILSFVRQEIDTLWGLQQAQVLAIAMLIISGIAICYLLKKSRHNAIIKYSKPAS